MLADPKKRIHKISSRLLFDHLPSLAMGLRFKSTHWRCGSQIKVFVNHSTTENSKSPGTDTVVILMKKVSKNIFLKEVD